MVFLIVRADGIVEDYNYLFANSGNSSSTTFYMNLWIIYTRLSLVQATNGLMPNIIGGRGLLLKELEGGAEAQGQLQRIWQSAEPDAVEPL